MGFNTEYIGTKWNNAQAHRYKILPMAENIPNLEKLYVYVQADVYLMLPQSLLKILWPLISRYKRHKEQFEKNEGV